MTFLVLYQKTLEGPPTPPRILNTDDLHLLAIHALLRIYSILKYIAYSSYWRGWVKSIEIFYFCFTAPSPSLLALGATKW
jgi:hypothetical protein